MSVEVWFANRVEPVWRRDYVHVATFPIPLGDRELTVELAWMRTQNLGAPWWAKQAEHVATELTELRGSRWGDVFVVEGDAYRVGEWGSPGSWR